MSFCLVVAALAPCLIFIILFLLNLALTPVAEYQMDPNKSKKSYANGIKLAGIGTFRPHLSNYMQTTRLIVGLASLSIGGFAAYFGKGPVRGVTYPTWSAVLSLSLLSWTVNYGVAFAGVLSWRYEEYCHERDSYNRTWYSANKSLGFSTLISFAFGYVFLALSVTKSF